MEKINAWGRYGLPVELSDVRVVIFEDDRGNSPTPIITAEWIELAFDMSMPFVPDEEYILQIDNLIWGVICLSEKMCNTGNSIRFKYRFKRVA